MSSPTVVSSLPYQISPPQASRHLDNKAVTPIFRQKKKTGEAIPRFARWLIDGFLEFSNSPLQLLLGELLHLYTFPDYPLTVDLNASDLFAVCVRPFKPTCSSLLSSAPGRAQFAPVSPHICTPYRFSRNQAGNKFI